MIFSDRDIKARLHRGDLVIEPLNTNNIQPSSIDLTLHSDFIRFSRDYSGVINVECGMPPEALIHEQVWPAESFRLQPGEFALACTAETVAIPDDIVAVVEGRSSLGRLGLCVHVTAGYIDPGFVGRITLELVNHNRYPIELKPGMRICQLVLYETISPAVNPYAGKYQHSESVVPSRIEKD